MARLSSMLELDDKLAGGAAAKAEAAAAEGAAKAKEEAVTTAMELKESKASPNTEKIET